MRFGLVIRVLAILWLIITLFMILPVIAALYYAEPLSPFLIPIAGAVAIFLPVILFFRRQSILHTRDVFLLVPLGWIGAAVISSIPFIVSATIPDFPNAFFEAMSGLTTTGASILEDIESLPKSMQLWRSSTHWLGGMGIVVLTVALLPFLGVGGVQLLKAESPGPSVDKVASGIASSAKILWVIYLLLTVVETILLLLGGLSFFDSLIHTFGTLATGGFSTKNASVGHFNSSYVHIVITVFMMLAGANFGIYYRIYSGKIRFALQDNELRAYIIVLLIATIIISVDLTMSGRSTGTSIRDAAFQSTSIMTTTGYATDDFAQWPMLSRAVLFMLMWVGGCAGSTGGGVKVIRYVIMCKQARQEIFSLFYPRAVLRSKSGNIHQSVALLRSVSGFIFIYFATIIVSTIIVAASGNDLITSLTTSLATLGNIGPGFAKVGPVMNYAFFPSWLKFYLSFLMLLGRLELYTVLVFLLAPFTRRY